MKTTTTVFLWIAGFVCLIALGWVLTFNQLGLRAFFAPKFQQVDRNVFEQSKAYRDGMAQEIRALQIEYVKADEKIKPALASAIKHKAAGVPDDALPADLSVWLRSLP